MAPAYETPNYVSSRALSLFTFLTLPRSKAILDYLNILFCCHVELHLKLTMDGHNRQIQLRIYKVDHEASNGSPAE